MATGDFPQDSLAEALGKRILEQIDGAWPGPEYALRLLRVQGTNADLVGKLANLSARIEVVERELARCFTSVR